MKVSGETIIHSRFTITFDGIKIEGDATKFIKIPWTVKMW